jgi:hypothetical protein
MNCFTVIGKQSASYILYSLLPILLAVYPALFLYANISDIALFSGLISKGVIESGEYRLGIIFRNPQDNTVYNIDTRKFLIHTSNQLRLSDSAVAP